LIAIPVRNERPAYKRDGLLVFGLILLIGVGSLATGNASTNSQRWLKFFFDGVPQNPITNKPGSVSTNQVHGVISPVPNIMSRGAVMVVHQPFGEGKCTQCHGDGGMSPQPKLPARQLCFTCHKDFMAGLKVKHQPVENGECASCHDPHQSPNKDLLIKKGNQLCLTCHDDPLAAGKVKHQAVESGDCLDCHTPHATNFKGLLKKSPKATCMECHADIAKKKDVHQPVGDGECMECHFQ
jgi:predicted CXXCH cytochrome family protein